ncbi:MAG: glycosyltransferase family 2 protein [Sellimonas intestinalis]
MEGVLLLPTLFKKIQEGKKMISLIIPTYNKLPRLKLTLASINFQTIDRSSFEVIVVKTTIPQMEQKQYLETQSFPFRIRGLHLSDNKGRSAARNEGLGKAQGDIVIFVDDDLILSPEYLKNHVLLQKECPRCVHGKIIDIFPLAYFKDPSKGILYETIDESSGKMDNFKKRCISVEDIFNDFERKIARYKTTSFMEETIHKILEREESKYHWIGMTGGNFLLPLKNG